MVDQFEKINCCGCGVCANVCSKHSITMQSDQEGFLYPVVDKNTCIECGLCVKKCPLTNNHYQTNMPPNALIVQTKDRTMLQDCTSGGFFSTLAQWVITQGGIVYGVKYNDSMNPIHDKANTIEGIKAFRGSKYVQSITGNIYQQVKEDLKNYPWVCFSGTPCQVAGLNTYLGKEYSNLISVDIVCHGVPSPKLWNKYKSFHEAKQHANIINAQFRGKKYGYLHCTMQLDFENGKSKNIFTMDDYFLAAFFSEICSRPSCHQCHFKYEQRKCDFTLFDCWDVASYPEFTSQNGATNVFLQSKKGRDIFNQLRNQLDYRPIEMEEAIRKDGSMIRKSTTPNHYRTDFFTHIDNVSLPKLRSRYYPLNKKIWFRSRVRDLLMVFGLYKLKK